MKEKTTKKILPKDNESNIPNPNKGTRGTNKQYSQNQGNRGKQLNPNQEKLKTVKEESNMTNSKPNPAPKPNRTPKQNPAPTPNRTPKPNPVPKPNRTPKPNPVPKPNPAPKPNLNYPSTTGNRSGKHRGNVKKNS